MAAVAAALSLSWVPVRAVAASATEGIPAYDHVVVLVLENESFASTFGPGSPAHYLNGTLVPKGAIDDQYYGTGHVSLDNYIAMTSAQPANPSTSSDCLGQNLYTCAQTTAVSAGGRNLGDQLDDAHRSWAGYMDSMPSPCFHAQYSPTAGADQYQGNSTAAPAGNYADRHNPFVYYPDIVGNDTRCRAHDVPYTQLSIDIAGGTVPAFAFITPDTCHDGHDSPCAGGQAGGLTSADAWLSGNVPPLLDYLSSHNGLLLVTFDEASTSDTSGCCHGGLGGTPGFGGRVGLLAIGPGVSPGQVIHTPYDHASLLRTVEDVFGITEHLNNAAPSVPMNDLFAPSAGQVPEAPTVVLLPLIGLALVIRRWRSHPARVVQAH
ncbi:MAG: phosphoesterase [Candidatus Dormibacteraeota bacterium]|uniref:Phosphoesterase n=1 Tax=Candidatus Amunia macphersoniae TaxID=3127014 RepID=A0A934KNC2_9BACT|nr:phosphoesterase [Candidatus Dormibacteraeota bacterium]